MSSTSVYHVSADGLRGDHHSGRDARHPITSAEAAAKPDAAVIIYAPGTYGRRDGRSGLAS